MKTDLYPVRSLEVPKMSSKYLKLYSDFEAMMLQDADDAITKCDLWEWLASYTPEEGKGFMFSNHPNLTKIDAALKYQGHSGSSYGWTMRTMQRVARLGWATFAEVTSNDNPPCPCRQAAGKWGGWCGVAGGGVPGCDH